MEYSEGRQGWLQVWLSTRSSKAGHLSSAQDGLCVGGEEVYKIITRTEKMNKETSVRYSLPYKQNNLSNDRFKNG